MLKHPNTMRIVALPLTTPLRRGTPPGPLTYFHFQLPPEPPGKGGAVKWVTDKAASLWAGFGKAEEGTWKRRTFHFGERQLDRIDFMELSLKSVDPSLGPKLLDIRLAAASPPEDGVEPTLDSEVAASETHTKIPLLYPGAAFTAGPSPVEYLQTLVKERIPRHRRGALFWLGVTPLTAPFMLIPIMPNLPFFFCAWRAWSNFSAYKASQYLAALIEHNAVVPVRDPNLDAVYRDSVPEDTDRQNHGADNSTAKSTSTSTTPDSDEVRPVLAREDVPKILELYELPSTAAADMYRAIEQAASRTADASAKDKNV